MIEFNTKQDILDRLNLKYERGDLTLIELAEIWANDEDVCRLYPELNDVLVRLDAVATELVAILDL